MNEIVEEKPVSMMEAQELLSKVEAREKDKELSFRAKKTKDYLKAFVGLKKAEGAKLKKALEELNIARLKDRQIVKIMDLLPEDLDSLKIILSGEAISPKPEDLKKIIDTVKANKK